MIMLDDLKDVLETIACKDEWAFNFVSDIIIKKEENPDYKLTGPQFRKLQELHNKYC